MVFIGLVVLGLIGYLFYVINRYIVDLEKKKQKKLDITEANKRRRYIESLSEKQVIEFADKKGMTELASWINYKGVLASSETTKFFVLRGWDDNECVPWMEVRRKSDNKVIYPQWH